MNDADVTSAVKERFAGVHMTTPVDMIVTRGRVLRRRRRIPALAAVVVVAGIALGLTLPRITPSAGSGSVSLAAWTVVRQPAGVVAVTVNELRDPAGLERKLRADGVPAIVRFSNQNPQPCLVYPDTPEQLRQIFGGSKAAQTADVAFHIRPSAIPSGAGLWLEVSPQKTDGTHSSYGMRGTLVYVSSPGCPGG